MYGQKGDTTKAIQGLKESINLKPNYRDPRYALAVYLLELSKKETDPFRKNLLIEEARGQLNYILKFISPDDQQSKELLKSIEQH